MKCANPSCDVETLYLRSGGIFAVDFPGAEAPGDGQMMQRRVIWLCDACSDTFSVETWRPPGEQVRLSGSRGLTFPRTRGRQAGCPELEPNA